MVGRIVDEFAQIVEQLYLRTGLGQFDGIVVEHLERLRCIHAQFGHRMALFVTLQFGFGGAQFVVDLADTVVDKLLGLEGYLVLVGVSLLVVAVNQCPDEVDAPARVDVFQRYFGYRTLFVERGYGQVSQESGGDHHRRVDSDNLLGGNLNLVDGGVLRKDERAIDSAQRVGQRCYLM